MKKNVSTTDHSSRPFADRLKIAGLNFACRLALRRIERRTAWAKKANRKALHDIIELNKDTEFGRAHSLQTIDLQGDFLEAFSSCVPLSTFVDYEDYVDRIAAGEQNILTSDPVNILAGSSGTTDRPKRIPRTKRAQRHHMLHVVLAAQAVVNRGIPGATEPERGINLMSLYAPPAEDTSAVPVMSGPNSGIARVRKQIDLLWSSPEVVFGIADQPSSHYVHALFGLLNRRALYIMTPYAPQMVSWFNVMEQHQEALVRDIRYGTLSSHLVLEASERKCIEARLNADPGRAQEIAEEFRRGFKAIAPRLWPNIKYILTITSGSFALSAPRLRWLAGPNLPFHSAGHSSSEGVIGINLKTDGKNEFVIASGTAYFEFIPRSKMDEEQPDTVAFEELIIGEEYEIVMTSCAGLYRYRIGDVIRITGFQGEAPTFNYLYRRGTILNLVGEKTTEFHTARALETAVKAWSGTSHALKDYSVTGSIDDGIGHYTFYVELLDNTSAGDPKKFNTLLDCALCETNEYYLKNGREPERIAQTQVKVVQPGTFDRLLQLQLRNTAGGNATQIKTPRLITNREHLALLEAQTMY